MNIGVYSSCRFLCVLLTSVYLVNLSYAGQNDEKIDKVHIIFMNHLDVGYNGIPTVGFINNIFNIYFHDYFPRAVKIAKQIQTDTSSNVSFIYTTHPWLVSSYLYCTEYPSMLLNNITLKCPSHAELVDFNWAVKNGFITWHAGPMNMQPENMNQFLFEQSLNISQQLDALYGIKREYSTLSQRDVPGMTQAVIPSLVKYGIKAVSVGVNPSTSPPDVPNPFLWQYEGEEVIAMWHKGGYPLNPGPSPSQPGGLSRDDCVLIEGFSQVLCFAFRTDNSGPPENLTEVESNFAILRFEFPGAELVASTFDKYIQALYPFKDSLPVLRHEVGDTWIQGISSDPLKMAKYRSFSQTLLECFQTYQCNIEDKRIMNAMRYLIKLPEHTWGLPTLGDQVNWTNSAFDKARKGPNYVNCEEAWTEQRHFVDLALTSLMDHSVATLVQYGLMDLIPKHYDLRQYSIISDLDQKFTCEDDIEIAFNNQGFIGHLFDPYNKMNWATIQNDIGHFLYNTYNQTDFDNMADIYSYNGNAGFVKGNMTENANPESKLWPMKLQHLYKNNMPGVKCDFLLKLAPEDHQTHTTYGAPTEILIQYTTRGIDPDVGGYPGGIDVIVQWFGKRATRLPESLSYSFIPAQIEGFNWRISKLGHLVDPANVVHNGSQYLHAVDDGVYYIDNNGNGLQLLTQDVPLVMLSTKQRPPSPFPVPLNPITQKDITGVAFNFYNNIWDTNYITYYPYLPHDDSLRSRFKINFYNRPESTGN